VDIRRSSRQVRVELDGVLLAESSEPHLVFETSLPARFYVPREDVVPEWWHTDRRTRCAYKGEAVYLALEVNGSERGDLAWSYENPLPEAAALKDLVAFFNEKVELTVDGTRRDQAQTGVAATIVDEAGV
jgi:uncharacterized protein (DUF427 family)